MAEYIKRETVLESINRIIADCNPDHFDLNEKESYGKWMLNNGINLGISGAMTAVRDLPYVVMETKAEAKEK